MAVIVADRVLETSTTTGTGAYTLSGAVVGYRAASAVCANGDQFTYFAEDVNEYGVPIGGWETGLGTWGTGGTLARTTIYASSNANAAVSWSAGTRRVSLSLLANAILGPTTVNGALTASGNIGAANFSGSSSGTNTGDQSAASILTSIKTVDGSGSGLDADLLDGAHLDTAWDSFGSGTVPKRHASGYLAANYFNCTANITSTIPTNVAMQTGDDFIRWQTLAQFKTNLGSFPASDVYSWAKAATKPTYTASEIGAATINDALMMAIALG